MLLYLRCLDYSVPQALTVTLKAMEQAEADMRRGSGESPLTASMRALRHLLTEQEGEVSEPRRPFLEASLDCPDHSAPPVRRLPMVSEEVIFAKRRSPNI